MRDLVLLQHDVIDAGLFELIAHGKAGLAAADHHDADMCRKRDNGHDTLRVIDTLFVERGYGDAAV